MQSHATFSENYRIYQQAVKAKNREALIKLNKSDFYERYSPIILLAQEGDSESVDFLINEFRVSRHLAEAVYGYAIGGHVDQVNKLIALSKIDYYRDCAMSGYSDGGHLKKENILRLMSYTDDQKLRHFLANVAKKKDGSLNVEELKEKAERIRSDMREYKIDYNQAYELGGYVAITWFLQGRQLLDKGLISDIYFKIALIVFDSLSVNEARRVVDSVNKSLFSDTKNSTTGFSSTAFSLWTSQMETEKFAREEEEEQKHQQRIQL